MDADPKSDRFIYNWLKVLHVKEADLLVLSAVSRALNLHYSTQRLLALSTSLVPATMQVSYYRTFTLDAYNVK